MRHDRAHRRREPIALVLVNAAVMIAPEGTIVVDVDEERVATIQIRIGVRHRGLGPTARRARAFSATIKALSASIVTTLCNMKNRGNDTRTSGGSGAAGAVATVKPSNKRRSNMISLHLEWSRLARTSDNLLDRPTRTRRLDN